MSRHARTSSSVLRRFSARTDTPPTSTPALDGARARHRAPASRRSLSTAGLAAAVLASPVLVATGAVGAAAPAHAGIDPSCVGTVVPAGANIQSVVNAKPEGAVLCLSDGTYRLGAPLWLKKGNVLWGAPGTRLEGSRVASTWAPSGSAWYTSGALPAAYTGIGICEDTSTNPCHKAEQVFRDGARLKRVMSRAAVLPGTFFADYAANRIYVGDNPAGHSLEVARTSAAIRSSSPSVTLRNLTIREFANQGQSGAVLVNGPGWKVLNNAIYNNHGVGLMVGFGDNAVVTGNRITDNGQLGLGQYRSNGVLIQANTISGNNTDGFWIADWESGGVKITESGGVLRGNTIAGNRGIGAWADVDAKGWLVEGNSITDNASCGVRLDISYDITVKANTILRNGFGMGRGGGTSLWATAGITSNTSSNVDIYHNTVLDNMNGIGLQARSRGSGRYGTFRLLNNKVHENRVRLNRGSQLGQGTTGLVQNLGDNSYYTSRGNVFYANTYELDSYSSRRFAWLNTYVVRSSWTSYGQDTAGRFTIIG